MGAIGAVQRRSSLDNGATFDSRDFRSLPENMLIETEQPNGCPASLKSKIDESVQAIRLLLCKRNCLETAHLEGTQQTAAFLL